MDEEESVKLKALSDIASIDISLEFENILQEILKITCKTMNAHSGTLMLVDEATEELKGIANQILKSNTEVGKLLERVKVFRARLQRV